MVAAEVRPLRRLDSASLVARPLVCAEAGDSEVQAEDSSALPRKRPRCAARELARDYMPLPARLEMDPNMPGVAMPGGGVPASASPSLLRGMVEERCMWWWLVLLVTGVEKGSPSTSDIDMERSWIFSISPFGRDS